MKLLILLLALMLPGPGMPADAAQDELAPQRNKFIQAEQALKKGNNKLFQQLSSELKDYPLYPYLQYAALRKNFGQTSFEAMAKIADEVSNTPLEAELRDTWLRSLAARGQWAEYLQAYRPSKGITLQCYHRRALLETGHKDQALATIETLWLTGETLPQACDAVLAAWKESGLMSQDRLWQRFQLAMNARNITLAHNLATSLSKAERPWAELWLRTHNNPSLILNSTDFSSYHPMRTAIITHGLRQLARRNASAAAELWTTEVSHRFQFNETERTEIVRIIATALTAQGRPEAYQWLANLDPGLVNERLSELRIRTALNQENWEATLDWIKKLPPEALQDKRWQYWRARALEKLGQHALAEDIYFNLAQYRDYYGFMAADRLNLPYRFTNRPLNIAEGRFSFKDHPALLRARELRYLNRIVEARREWYFATQPMSDAQLQWAAKLAHSWGWYDRAILTVAKTSNLDDLEVRFPLAHYDKVISEAHASKIEPALAYAVIRQESAFTTDARSGVGALGLMQLMPRTAKVHAKSLGIQVDQRNLIDARTNIRLGMSHLRSVLDEFKNHPLLATAAYNAGEGAVRRWLPESGSVASDIWAESIPYNETRNYAQNILAFTAIYEQRLGQQPTPLEVRMPPVQGRGKQGNKPADAKQPSDNGTPALQ
ncbi:MAG: transglycosylase SLT domain-containing protein [Gammaproteobacteria bacterium]|nr:transglycosylase SLT domain-containing protein [Gammaproteobacteria bacterium]